MSRPHHKTLDCKLDGVTFTAEVEIEEDDNTTPGSVVCYEISDVMIGEESLPEWVVDAIEDELKWHAEKEASCG